MWEKCKNKSPDIQLAQYIKFRKKCINYLKGHQDAQAKEQARLKEHYKSKMEYDSQNTSQEIDAASIKYHEILAHEQKGAEIRSRCKIIQGASKNTKYHFALASKNHKKSLIKMVLKHDGTETVTWAELSNTITDYWEHDVLSFRPIQMPALEAVERTIHRTLPGHKRHLLGVQTNTEDLPRIPTTIISPQDVYSSISTTKLSKSPGIDGLPGEFYALLIEDHEDEDNCIIAQWLHAIFVNAFRTCILP
jgi:hypothetical protein